MTFALGLFVAFDQLLNSGQIVDSYVLGTKPKKSAKVRVFKNDDSRYRAVILGGYDDKQFTLAMSNYPSETTADVSIFTLDSDSNFGVFKTFYFNTDRKYRLRFYELDSENGTYKSYIINSFKIRDKNNRIENFKNNPQKGQYGLLNVKLKSKNTLRVSYTNDKSVDVEIFRDWYFIEEGKDIPTEEKE